MKFVVYREFFDTPVGLFLIVNQAMSIGAK